ncbi:MAG: HAD family hydrolase [Planctomycetota bacterium]|jgi:hypothetical protein
MKRDKTCKIGVDLDGTISEYPEFFRLFTKAMADAGCKIYIITDRMPDTEPQVQRELENYGLTYHAVKITSDKAGFIEDEGITVLFDDMDRYFRHLPEHVAVFKIRQKYNFNFERMIWRD